jgi:hypothetical protein
MSRILPRYTDHAITHDPLETMLAQRQAEEERARLEVGAGRTPLADPADLRGIPCIARGAGGTSPGTAPEGALLSKERRTTRHAA